jgi:hypothetical protein
VLQHLMRVRDAESVVRVVQGVHVANGEVGVGLTGGLLAGLVYHGLRGVDTGHATVWHVAGETGRDRAGAAADIQDPHVRLQVRQQVGGRVLGGAPSVRQQDRFMMTVRIDLRHAVIV